jgi:HSP20 family protein
MSLFPRFTQEFAPLFRLFDEYDRQAFRNTDQQIRSLRSFTPRFDVKETKENYELHGELPGIEQNDINIEWTDNNTLAISGRHEHVREEGTRPQGLIENDIDSTQQPKKLEHQPTVEEDSTDTSTRNTQVSKLSEEHQVDKNEGPRTKYWVSERSVGEFHRSFAFPARVDQDAVKASLKNGILSIVVPKAQAPQPRKINIE